VKAVSELLDGAVVNMSAGEGKSLVYHAWAGRKVVQDGVDSVQVITTRDTLAAREFIAYQGLLSRLGFEIVRMNPDGNVPPRVKGRPTIYVGTQQDIGFSYLRGKPWPGRHAIIDEIDEALVYADTQYVISEGASSLAPKAVKGLVKWAHTF